MQSPSGNNNSVKNNGNNNSVSNKNSGNVKIKVIKVTKTRPKKRRNGNNDNNNNYISQQGHQKLMAKLEDVEMKYNFILANIARDTSKLGTIGCVGNNNHNYSNDNNNKNSNMTKSLYQTEDLTKSMQDVAFTNDEDQVSFDMNKFSLDSVLSFDNDMNNKSYYGHLMHSMDNNYAQCAMNHQQNGINNGQRNNMKFLEKVGISPKNNTNIDKHITQSLMQSDDNEVTIEDIKSFLADEEDIDICMDVLQDFNEKISKDKVDFYDGDIDDEYEQKKSELKAEESHKPRDNGRGRERLRDLCRNDDHKRSRSRSRNKGAKYIE